MGVIGPNVADIYPPIDLSPSSSTMGSVRKVQNHYLIESKQVLMKLEFAYKSTTVNNGTLIDCSQSINYDNN